MYSKHELKTRYGIPVTAELKLKDEQGWYRQLRLHYFFSRNPQKVQTRDKSHLENHLERGDGQICFQDMHLLTSKVEALKVLKIEQFLDPDRLIRKSDEDVLEFQRLALQYRTDIKTILGVSVPDSNPIQALGMFLARLGVKLDCVKRELLKDGTRQRVYQYQQPHDGRDKVFAYWDQQEECPQADIKDLIQKTPGLKAA